jgi:hypothetical protein
MGGRGSALGGNERPIHSQYRDGTPVYKGQQPLRLGAAKSDPKRKERIPS